MSRPLDLLLADSACALLLHPIAMVLAFINIWSREDGNKNRILWTLICLIWGFGPILYVVLANGRVLPFGEPHPER